MFQDKVKTFVMLLSWGILCFPAHMYAEALCHLLILHKLTIGPVRLPFCICVFLLERRSTDIFIFMYFYININVLYIIFSTFLISLNYLSQPSFHICSKELPLSFKLLLGILLPECTTTNLTNPLMKDVGFFHLLLL